MDASPRPAPAGRFPAGRPALPGGAKPLGVLAAAVLAAAAAAADSPPWEAALAKPIAWADMAGDPLDGGGLTAAGLAAWLEPCDGGQRLRAPWPADAVLRLRFPLDTAGEVVFHDGDAAAVFRFSGPAGWSTHRLVRSAADPAAAVDEVWETDDGLYWKFHAVEISWRKFRGKIRDERTVRPNATPLDFFWRDGAMHLWRGDMRLVSAPLPGPPREVVLRFPVPPERIAMARLTEPPSSPRHRPPAAVDSAKPGELAWNLSVTPPASASRPAGGLTLTAPETAQPAQATLPLPVAGVCDAVFVVERATNGTGVFLGGPAGQPLAGVQISQAGGASLAVALANPWDAAPPPLDLEPAGRPVWIRLLPASGMLRCWQSRDGLHWALVGTKPMPTDVPVASCGIMAGPGTPRPRTLTLARLQVRDYSGFNTLAPAEVRGRVPAVMNQSVDAWRQWAAQTRPAEVPPATWQRAAAVRSLGLGPPRPVANWLLRRLLEDAPRVARPVAQHAALLAEFPDLAALAWVAPWDGRPDEPIAADLAAAAAALGDAIQLDGESGTYSDLGRQAMAARMGPFAQLNYDSPDATVLPELVQLIAAGRAGDAERTARLVQRLGRDGAAAAVQWGIDAAAAVRRGDPLAPAPHAGGWPAARTEASKTQVLYLAELETACKAGNAPRVAQLLADFEPNAAGELLPDPRDPLVGQTAAAAIGRVLAEAPAIASASGPAPAGKLRVRIAAGAGNAGGVIHAAGQFAGTPAAAEAAIWIGDRLLASGAATVATVWYERGLATADLVQRETIKARLEAATKAAAGAAPPVDAVAVPGPAAMRAGQLPDPAPDRPWVGRALAVAAAGDSVVAQDDRTLAMLTGGRVVWQAACEGGAVAPPAVAGEFTIATTGPGLRLHRFATADGQPRGGPVTIEGAVPVLSTPWINATAARAFVQGQAAGSPALALAATAFEAPAAAPPVPALPWTAPGGCPPLAVGDVLLAFVEGGIAGCEAFGPLRWFRRQDSISAEAQAAAGAAVATRSFAIGTDAIVWQPRVPYVERIEAGSGRRIWCRPLPRIRRLLGIVADRVIVEAGRRLVALDARDGRVAWSTPVGELLPPAAVGPPGGILVTRRAADLACPELLWFDPAAGRPVGAARLDPLAGEGSSFGPWVTGRDRITAFIQDAAGVVRLVELTPAGAAAPAAAFVDGGIW